KRTFPISGSSNRCCHPLINSHCYVVATPGVDCCLIDYDCGSYGNDPGRCVIHAGGCGYNTAPVDGRCDTAAYPGVCACTCNTCGRPYGCG
ncbi:unnamed protein product, partial [Rotaria sp. Silwood1]